MQNPWTHDDPPELSSGGDARWKLLGAIVWGFLLVGIGVGIWYASRGMVDLSNITTVYRAVAILVVMLIAAPILKKVLAISRTLATVVFLAKLGVIATILFV